MSDLTLQQIMSKGHFHSLQLQKLFRPVQNREKNTYILSWSACETLCTDLSLLTFLSLDREKKVRKTQRKGERQAQIIQG